MEQLPDHILDEALARYAGGEELERIVASLPQYRREVEDALLMARALELDRGRVHAPPEVLRAALTGGSVTRGALASYRESKDDSKGRVLVHEIPTVLTAMWKTLVPVAVVVVLVIVVVALRSGTTPTLTLAPEGEADDAAFDKLVMGMDGYFADEDELTLALDAAGNGGAAVATAAPPPSAGADPLDAKGVEQDAAAAENLEMEQFLNEEDGLEGDLNY